MKIAGRKKEVTVLQGLLNKSRSEFVAVYGRRRIGKTYLVRSVYAKQIVFECSGLHEKSFKQQLENFWIALYEANPQFKREGIPTSWLQAFSQLKTHLNGLPADEKKVIFLDEISWFDTPRAGFVAALDNFWNQYCTKRDDIILVICGSAASWIIQKVVNDRGGLHNRITRHVRLMPFTLAETQDFLELEGINWELIDITRMYMCTGGIPYYLTDLTPGQSVPQALDELFFGPSARLHNEFQNLYAALFKNHQQHEKVVASLAQKKVGMSRSELLPAIGLQSGGGLSTILEELIACGFVMPIYPIKKQKEDVLYRLVDEFTLFYYHFLHLAKSKTSWQELYDSQAYRSWAGYAFELVCLKHLDQVKKSLGIFGIITNDYSWKQKGTAIQTGTQIDLLIDRADNCINLLEMKFYDSPFEMSKENAENLREKVRIFKESTRIKKNVFVTLITSKGAVKNKYYLGVVSNALGLEELFEG